MRAEHKFVRDASTAELGLLGPDESGSRATCPRSEPTAKPSPRTNPPSSTASIASPKTSRTPAFSSAKISTTHKGARRTRQGRRPDHPEPTNASAVSKRITGTSSKMPPPPPPPPHPAPSPPLHQPSSSHAPSMRATRPLETHVPALRPNRPQTSLRCYPPPLPALPLPQPPQPTPLRRKLKRSSPTSPSRAPSFRKWMRDFQRDLEIQFDVLKTSLSRKPPQRTKLAWRSAFKPSPSSGGTIGGRIRRQKTRPRDRQAGYERLQTPMPRHRYNAHGCRRVSSAQRGTRSRRRSRNAAAPAPAAASTSTSTSTSSQPSPAPTNSATAATANHIHRRRDNRNAVRLDLGTNTNTNTSTSTSTSNGIRIFASPATNAADAVVADGSSVADCRQAADQGQNRARASDGVQHTRVVQGSDHAVEKKLKGSSTACARSIAKSLTLFSARRATQAARRGAQAQAMMHPPWPPCPMLPTRSRRPLCRASATCRRRWWNASR